MHKPDFLQSVIQMGHALPYDVVATLLPLTKGLKWCMVIDVKKNTMLFACVCAHGRTRLHVCV
jgi:hypothetical protein